MVWSIIRYGAAIWGNRQFSCINIVLLRAARYYIEVGRYSPNSAVLGDTGWKPTIVRQWLAAINQYVRLKEMDTTRSNYKIFMWAEGNSNGICQNWNYRLNKMLAEANIVYDPCVTNPRIFKAKLAEHLYENFIHSWVEDINRINARQGNGKNKLRINKTYKNYYRTEQYLQCFITEMHIWNSAVEWPQIRMETGR